MTLREASELVKRILAAYPAQRQRMTADDVQAMVAEYFDGLRDLSLEIAAASWQRVKRSARFIPTIAELREAAMVVVHGARKSGGEAWGEALQLIRKHGSHRTPGVDFKIIDPLVAKTIEVYGWSELCRGGNHAADRSRFIDTYELLSQGERKETQIAEGVKALPDVRPDKYNAGAIVDGLAKQLTRGTDAGNERGK